MDPQKGLIMEKKPYGGGQALPSCLCGEFCCSCVLEQHCSTSQCRCPSEDYWLERLQKAQEEGNAADEKFAREVLNDMSRL